ncbi:MAG: hypothetical protein KIT36_20925 [Alphaproteobacteria bacterium]|nr:hypothetical protein [Alphaproteobacteria bacterium]
MTIFRSVRAIGPVTVMVALSALTACGKSGELNKAAYDVCLKAAQQDSKIGKASFAPLEGANIVGSTGEEEIRVNIPYELEGKKGLFQCIAQKQRDGSLKVVF